MSTQYNTEPPPTATVLLQTTAGPLTISIFANQTPLTSRNFLQHVLDGYYNDTLFHRISSGFVIQTGDPTGTGEGGENIYEDRNFERYDEHWARVLGREKGEKIVFEDEIHSRLKFNRRGLVGMAKGTGDGSGYGSQFFITLGDCRAQLDGKCTMFGRVEGDGIYNVVKVAEGEVADGTERPVYPEKIISAEVLEMPKGDAWSRMQKREIVAKRVVEEPVKKKAPKKKAGKALLSFGGDEGEDDGPGVVVRPKKAKFNTALIDGGDLTEEKKPNSNGTGPKRHESPPPAKRKAHSPPSATSPTVPQKWKASSETLSKSPSSSPTHRRKPSFHDSTTQLPLRDPESPSRSPTPQEQPRKQSTVNNLQAEIAALKASMRRDIAPATQARDKKSALESLIPPTSTRGRKRPRPGDLNSTSNAKDDASALQMLNAFKARLEKVDEESGKGSSSEQRKGKGKGEAKTGSSNQASRNDTKGPTNSDANDETEEAHLCDLHFIANCQSCSSWDKQHHHHRNPDATSNSNSNPNHNNPDTSLDLTMSDDDDDDDRTWMSHTLSFAKDRLGKDLTWKKKNEEELVVIDPREREREVLGGINNKSKGKGKGRERENRR